MQTGRREEIDHPPAENGETGSSKDGLTNPSPRIIDVRVGSSTDGRVPISVVERSLAARSFQWLGLAAIAVAALIADQLTKQIVISQLDLGEAVHVGGPLYLHHVKNSGIAFGMFDGAAGPVTIFTAVAVLAMLIYFARSGARHPILPVALGLLIGGSLSNLVDRLRVGHVTDFIDFQWWPAFNLADTFIVVGVGILLLALIASERRPRLHSNRAARSG